MSSETVRSSIAVQGRHVRLGVNIDHVATIRNARGGGHPEPLRAAQLAARAGADGITAHLREDRRHISDDDISRLAREIPLPLNLEMAATSEMLKIAIHHRPNACCLVPEKREELTTEGGLDVASAHRELRGFILALKNAGIRTSLFIDPDPVQVAVARALDADIVELHTGSYAHAFQVGNRQKMRAEYRRLADAARDAAAQGLEVHAGHGLSFETAGPVAALPQIVELNIGHFLVGEAIFDGLEKVIGRMRAVIDAGTHATEPVDI
jgi:pyridoxine 5-phosphate synthase